MDRRSLFKAVAAMAAGASTLKCEAESIAETIPNVYRTRRVIRDKTFTRDFHATPGDVFDGCTFVKCGIVAHGGFVTVRHCYFDLQGEAVAFRMAED